jgi:hypothetical protein
MTVQATGRDSHSTSEDTEPASTASASRAYAPLLPMARQMPTRSPGRSGDRRSIASSTAWTTGSSGIGLSSGET